MKFYVKVMKDGKESLVEATQEQVLDPDVILFNEKGETLDRKPIKTEKDPVAELTDMVKDIAVSLEGVDALKERTEVMEAQLRAYQEAEKRGFVVSPTKDADAEGDKDADEFSEYNMAKQGALLMDKFRHPRTTLTDEKREEMAKYYIRLIRCARKNPRPKDVETFYSHYGEVKNNTTDLGDSGNLFPVPDVVDSEILSLAREQSVVLQEARMWPMSSEKMSFPVEGAGANVAWGNTTAEDTPTAPEAELEAKELSAYASVKNMTLSDSVSDIVSWMTEWMGEGAGQAIDDAAFNGTGDPCSGIFLLAGYSVVMATGSTDFSDITATHLSDMIAKLNGRRKEGAKFYLHGTMLHYIRELKDSNNRPIFSPGYIGNAQPPTIWGYPHREVVKAPSTSAANTGCVIFGNLKYLMVGRRENVSTLDVDPYGLWTTNRTRFKLYQRWAITVPPMGSGGTLSKAFVKLVTAAS